MNEKFSLVLSGGSALGFAHLGVIKYLEENNKVPAEILGTSMGALIGVAYSKDRDFSKIYEFFKSRSYIKMFRPDFFHKGNLISNGKIRKEISDYLEGKDFDDLDIDLKIVATNSQTGECEVFDKNSGVSLVDALCASTAIPGVFSPYKIGDKTYYDGFLTSNLPFEFSTYKPYCFNVVNQYLIGDNEDKTSFGNFRQMALILVYNQHRLKQNYLNRDIVLVDLDVSKYTLFDFHKLDELLELGYRQSIGKLSSLE